MTQTVTYESWYCDGHQMNEQFLWNLQSIVASLLMNRFFSLQTEYFLHKGQNEIDLKREKLIELIPNIYKCMGWKSFAFEI